MEHLNVIKIIIFLMGISPLKVDTLSLALNASWSSVKASENSLDRAEPYYVEFIQVDKTGKHTTLNQDNLPTTCSEGVIFLMDGFGGGITSSFMTQTSAAIRANYPDVTLVLVNTNYLSSAPNVVLTYLPAAINTGPLGRQVGAFILALRASCNGDLKRFRIIAFSLGVHAAGWAGFYLRLKGYLLGRITGCDPAGPVFDCMPPNWLIRPIESMDASKVDIIVTDAPPWPLFNCPALPTLEDFAILLEIIISIVGNNPDEIDVELLLDAILSSGGPNIQAVVNYLSSLGFSIYLGTNKCRGTHTFLVNGGSSQPDGVSPHGFSFECLIFSMLKPCMIPCKFFQWLSFNEFCPFPTTPKLCFGDSTDTGIDGVGRTLDFFNAGVYYISISNV